MQHHSIKKARIDAKEYENSLDAQDRKLYGKYFTGLPLSKLLAKLSLKHDCQLVIDPMAGHGDILDATLEIAETQSIRLKVIHGIEINTDAANVCKKRLQPWLDLEASKTIEVFVNDAFDPTLIHNLEPIGYDLVITNPPFVRYQITSGRHSCLNRNKIRRALLEIAADRLSANEMPIWSTLIQSYSGLADLSVPSWLLAGMLVRPGGTLALVAPATWESRRYAHIIKYLLFKCFKIETIVTDTPPGWFSGALVRTQLIVAKKLDEAELLTPMSDRKAFDKYTLRIEIAPNAKNEDSIVGNCFPGPNSEFQFFEWLTNGEHNHKRISNDFIKVRYVPIIDELRHLKEVFRDSRWFNELEPLADKTVREGNYSSIIPERISNILPHLVDYNLRPITESNIQIGQGLRTGCNDFFYVTHLQKLNDRGVKVKLSALFNNEELAIPSSVVRPVLRHQSDMSCIVKSKDDTKNLVLDLRNSILPEDYLIAEAAKESYVKMGKVIPSIMPQGLSEYVRKAASTIYTKPRIHRLIPELSAVHTNVRKYDPNRPLLTPRFWYMLPDFTTRHIPEALIPRINHDIPLTIANSDPPIIVDANFSTIWQIGRGWTSKAIVALLNSTWCRTNMEIMGTPLAGGALKLEATQLRQLQIPMLSGEQRESLGELGEKLLSSAMIADENILKQIDHLVIGAILRDSDIPMIEDVLSRLKSLLFELFMARRRVVSRGHF